MRNSRVKRIAWCSGALAMVVCVNTMTAGHAIAQQEAEVQQSEVQQVAVQQVEVQLVQQRQQQQLRVQTFEADGIPQVADIFAAVEPVAVPALTPDEVATVKETIRRLHLAIAPEAGDNLLAEVFDYQEGQIIRSKRGSAQEVLKFDPQGELSLKEWVVANLSEKTVQSWTEAEVSPVSANEEFVTVTISHNISNGATVQLRRTGHGFQIYSVSFFSYFC